MDAMIAVIAVVCCAFVLNIPAVMWAAVIWGLILNARQKQQKL